MRKVPSISGYEKLPPAEISNCVLKYIYKTTNKFDIVVNKKINKSVDI